jgi:hypothetical protein
MYRGTKIGRPLLGTWLKAWVKVVFVNDKVQAKDILGNMDVHNFAVNLFRQSGTG